MAETSTTKTPATGEKAAEKPSADDALAKLRAAHAARKARRSFHRPSSTGRKPGESPVQSSEPKPVDSETKTGDSKTTTDDSEKTSANADNVELENLRSELASAKVEMASMLRNHVANVQKLSAERDMFALQLAQEQAEAPPESVRGIEDLRAQLKASRMRNANLEEENVQLRQERKDLALRVTASKTLDAASTGYEKVVIDLIDVKLQCATLSDEKEAAALEIKNLKSDNQALSNANGLLEKSRADWVLKCADLERKLQSAQDEIEHIKLVYQEEAEKNKPITVSSILAESRSGITASSDKSPSQNSELHELAL